MLLKLLCYCDGYRILLVHLCSLHHTSFVNITDSATSSLSGVSCVLWRPSFMAPVSISISFNWYLLRPEGLYCIAWFWLKPGWCEGSLKRPDRKKCFRRSNSRRKEWIFTWISLRNPHLSFQKLSDQHGLASQDFFRFLQLRLHNNNVNKNK